MVTQMQTHAPEQKTRRERRIEMLAERRRRIKKTLKKMCTVTFDNDMVTEAGNFQFMELFKEPHRLPRDSASMLIDYLTDCALLGHTRFLHMNAQQSGLSKKLSDSWRKAHSANY